jgi:hypothetical protein
MNDSPLALVSFKLVRLPFLGTLKNKVARRDHHVNLSIEHSLGVYARLSGSDYLSKNSALRMTSPPLCGATIKVVLK